VRTVYSGALQQHCAEDFSLSLGMLESDRGGILIGHGLTSVTA
jgi:hypothetical protein